MPNGKLETCKTWLKKTLENVDIDIDKLWKIDGN